MSEVVWFLNLCNKVLENKNLIWIILETKMKIKDFLIKIILTHVIPVLINVN